MSSATALIASCTAGAPAGANLYEYCAASLNYTLQPPAYPWMGKFMIALSALYAVFAIIFAVLLGLRFRRGDNWLFRRADTPHGTIIVPHVINLSCLFSIAYYVLGQGNVATVYLIATDPANQAPLVSNMVFTGVTFIPLFCQLHFDLAATLINLSGVRRRSLSVRSSHARLSLLINAFTIGWPLLVTIVVIALFGVMAGQGAQRTVDALSALQARLRAIPWNGAISLQQLAPVAPAGAALGDAVERFVQLQREAFGFWLAAVAVLFVLWIPAAGLHVRSLLKQIDMLRGTASKLAATRGSPSTGGSSNGSSKTPDAAEKRVRYLMRVCWFRVAIAICLCVAVGLFAAIVLLLTMDPNKTAKDTARNTFVRLGSLVGPLALAIPLMIAAAQHPRDAAAAQAPSTIAYPSPLTDYSPSHSPSEKSHGRATSLGSSRWVTRGAHGKAVSTNDSAIYILPHIGHRSPIPLSEIGVEVETVIQHDYDIEDDFASAHSLPEDRV